MMDVNIYLIIWQLLLYMLILAEFFQHKRTYGI